MKQSRLFFGRKRKPTGYIFLYGSQYREAEGHLKLRSCLHDAIKLYKKHELYRQ